MDTKTNFRWVICAMLFMATADFHGKKLSGSEHIVILKVSWDFFVPHEENARVAAINASVKNFIDFFIFMFLSVFLQSLFNT